MKINSLINGEEEYLYFLILLENGVKKNIKNIKKNLKNEKIII
jgi:hypothetical protein